MTESCDNDQKPRILGVARFSKGRGRENGEAEFALLIRDNVFQLLG